MFLKYISPCTKKAISSSFFHFSSSSPSSNSSGTTTHFGFKEVPVEEKAKMVGSVFHKVADNYDLMNDVLSLGIHRVWKDWFVSMVNPQLGCEYLDVAGGTGDISFRIADALSAKALTKIKPPNPSRITVLDINSSMLKVGEDRAKSRAATWSPTVAMRWMEGDAQALALPSESVDQYTIAFGIRNVTDVPKAIKEAHRVLRRGGRFLCLEFSKTSPLVTPICQVWNHQVMPVLGHVLVQDWGSYKYLAESINRFPDQEKFKSIIEEAGFKNVSYTNYSLGIVAVHDGWKL